MSKPLTDQELKTRLPKLNRGQLEYLLQVVQQLEKYQAQLTKEEKFFLEKLTEELKAKLLLLKAPKPFPFKLDLQFFEGEKKLEELLRETKELLKVAEEERRLAAEAGKDLLKKNQDLLTENNNLQQANQTLQENINFLNNELQTEISNKEAAAQ